MKYNFIKSPRFGFSQVLLPLVLLVAGCSYDNYSTVNSDPLAKSSTIKLKLRAEQVDGEAGAQIGAYMDHQLAEYSKLDDATGKREAQGIHLTIDSKLFFDASSHTLKEEGKATCQDLHSVFKGSPDSEMLVEVHTDDIGSRYYNQGLSERRANSISEYLNSLGASSQNISFKSYGEDQPKADSSFGPGRDSNRRIEIAIYAGNRLKELAQSGKAL
ncbi:MAG: OmpA family protein [Cyclobacteriaceae bacterium]